MIFEDIHIGECGTLNCPSCREGELTVIKAETSTRRACDDDGDEVYSPSGTVIDLRLHLACAPCGRTHVINIDHHKGRTSLGWTNG